MLNKLRQFMAGRNGTDALNSVLLIAALALDIIGGFTISWALTLIAAATIGFVLFRFFSKNLAARRRENQRFLAACRRVAGFFRGASAKAAQSKEYRFYKCPECGQKVRVPKGRGKIRITCPKCGEKFEKRT